MIALGSMLSTWAASAEAFPDRPIHIVVPFPAAGSNDVVARFLGQKLSDICGQSVIIDNRAGAGGMSARSSSRGPRRMDIRCC
jgi:tripartite-type tricarboxylate transporter receptor subunit TctC